MHVPKHSPLCRRKESLSIALAMPTFTLSLPTSGLKYTHAQRHHEKSWFLYVTYAQLSTLYGLNWFAAANIAERCRTVPKMRSVMDV